MAPDPSHADQVYRSLKGDILSGRYPPGSVPNIQHVADEIGFSISPVRDAMERLVGERLLLTRAGGGFQLPPVTEASLRDLYLWHSYLTRGAVRSTPALHSSSVTGEIAAVGPEDDQAIVTMTARLFLELGAGAGSEEHFAAVRSTGERLALPRLAERRLRDRKPELERLMILSLSGSKAALKEAISVYHRRRLRHLPEILRALHLVGISHQVSDRP